jgi:anti-sigma regulatory factor (Ser/Thr protein kinase)
LETLVVDGVRTFAGVPESVRAARHWVVECLAGSRAATNAALVVSELFTNAIFYTTSGHADGLVTMSIAISRGMARIHVIDQGGRFELSQPSCSTSAARTGSGLGKGLTIVRALADEFVTDGPDKCVTLRVAGPVRPSPPDGPGESPAEARFLSGHPMRDPYTHAEKTSVPGFGRLAIRALFLAVAGVAPDLPKTVRTGCGLRRSFPSTSTIPEQLTCPACREWMRGRCLFMADTAARALELTAETNWPGPPTTEELEAEELTYRALAARLG